jgi:hypothetical protein
LIAIDIPIPVYFKWLNLFLFATQIGIFIASDLLTAHSASRAAI